MPTSTTTAVFTRTWLQRPGQATRHGARRRSRAQSSLSIVLSWLIRLLLNTQTHKFYAYTWHDNTSYSMIKCTRYYNSCVYFMVCGVCKSLRQTVLPNLYSLRYQRSRLFVATLRTKQARTRSRVHGYSFNPGTRLDGYSPKI